MTALVGPSGSGKSKIAKMITGFWDVNEGEIRLGGQNIRKISQQQLACLIWEWLEQQQQQ